MLPPLSVQSLNLALEVKNKLHCLNFSLLASIPDSRIASLNPLSIVRNVQFHGGECSALDGLGMKSETCIDRN